MEDQIQISLEDIIELFKRDPLVAEKAKVVTLGRELREARALIKELEGKLASLTPPNENGTGDPQNIPAEEVRA